MNEVRERGIHLINQIHMAIVRIIVYDLKVLNNGGSIEKANKENTKPQAPFIRTREQSAVTHQQEQLQSINFIGNKGPNLNEDQPNAVFIYSIMKLEESQENLWPELLRILLLQADERQDIDSEALQENSYMGDLLRKLGSLSP
mmetsp:Transcript_28092/g.42492  ORF Transcript_28092/g.42492 Transcript_28092/m.42492 type:complete len:144 (+) Transcript_28092:1577-2008(+)